MSAALGGALGLALFGAGCSPKLDEGFDSPDPITRGPAIVAAARDRDRSKLADLVRALDSNDAAERMLAIGALEQLTGQTLGYRAYDDPVVRDAATERWRRWLEAQGEGRNTSPVGVP